MTVSRRVSSFFMVAWWRRAMWARCSSVMCAMVFDSACPSEGHSVRATALGAAWVSGSTSAADDLDLRLGIHRLDLIAGEAPGVGEAYARSFAVALPAFDELLVDGVLDERQGVWRPRKRVFAAAIHE